MSNTETGYKKNRRQRQKEMRRQAAQATANVIQPRGAPVAGTSKKPQRKN